MDENHKENKWIVYFIKGENWPYLISLLIFKLWLVHDMLNVHMILTLKQVMSDNFHNFLQAMEEIQQCET